MQENWVLYEKDGNVARIILNRPEKLNAMTDSMFEGVVKHLRHAENDDDIKVVIIKANGTHFCSGWDLSEIARMYKITDAQHGEKASRAGQRFAIKLDRSRSELSAAVLFSMKTTIAQVHGYCLGMGWFLAILCDFVVASDDAVFGHPEQRLGASGTFWTLPLEILHCGPKKARELMLTGRQFGAEEAERLLLINKVVPRDKLEEEANELARTVCLQPRDGLMIGKAYTHMTYSLLGMNSAFIQYYASHPLVVGLKWEPGEYNFPKARRDKGLKQATEGRDARFGEEYK